MIFMFRTRAWVPGCLGGRSRGAWAASPGSLGRLPGAPGGGFPIQTTRPSSPRRPLGFASKIVIKNDIAFDAKTKGARRSLALVVWVPDPPLGDAPGTPERRPRHHGTALPGTQAPMCAF